MASTDIHIGTSGYSFADWKGPFYPEKLKQGEMLAYYSRFFDTVEINATYYRIPPPGAFAEMARKTDDDFIFFVKLHKSMTHEREGELEPFGELFNAVSPLEEAGRFAGFLAQFPWSFKNSDNNFEYLGWLVEKLAGRPLFVEFRHVSWITDPVLDMMREKGVGYCIVDEPQHEGMVPSVLETTTPAAYIRLHGRNEEDWWNPRPGSDRYLYDYSDRELGEWAEKVLQVAETSERVYMFFNNCHFGNAPLNARKMKQLLGLPDLRGSLSGELEF
ncbi:DUF72 domain-containing protein [bacterium]